MTQEDSTAAGAPAHIAAAIGLLRKSPEGLVRCAADWLEGAKGNYGFDMDDEGFAAAGAAFAGAPDIFVGADGDSWSESSRPKFWRLFFQARALGAPVADFKAAITTLPKATLALGAKHMLISAARAKDPASFGELLDMGAARRSKLVMFSAYQHGGMRVALQVKAPTALEALEMLANAAGGWRGARAMTHDVEGFEWLANLSGKPIAALLAARIIANSEDPASFEKAIGDRAAAMLYPATKEYVHQMGMQIERNEEQVTQVAILAMASAGAPQAAKALALAKGGMGLWRKACFEGFAGVFNLPVRKATPQSAMADLTVGASEGKVDVNLQARVTPQHGAALSRDAGACEWLRAEYEALGAPWLPAQELLKAFKGMQTQRLNFGVDGPRLAEEASSLSEAIDLRGGLQAGKLDTARKKSRSL